MISLTLGGAIENLTVKVPSQAETGNLNQKGPTGQAALERLIELLIRPLCAADLGNLTKEATDAEAVLTVILNELGNRPQVAELVMKKANSSREKDEILGLESSIRIQGVDNIRDYIVIEKISDLFASKAFERNKTSGEIQAAPQTLLKYATKAREIFSDFGHHKDYAYASGLIFDCLVFLNGLNPDIGIKKKQSDFIEECFKEGLAIAKIAMALGKTRGRLVLEKQLISSVMVNQASYAAMSLVIPDYLPSLRGLKKKSIPLSIQNLVSTEQFKIAHCSFSALLCWPFPIFDGIGPALLHFDAPLNLTEKENINLFDLAAIGFLASHMWSHKQELQKQKILTAKEIRPELKDFDLTIDMATIFGKGG